MQNHGLDISLEAEKMYIFLFLFSKENYPNRLHSIHVKWDTTKIEFLNNILYVAIQCIAHILKKKRFGHSAKYLFTM